MNINYFLSTKKEYHKVLYGLNEIIDRYEELKDIQDDYSKSTTIDNPFIIIFDNENTKDIFIKLKKHIKEFIQICDTEIEKLCSHDFVYDVVDISPDHSKQICYCTKCEFTSS